MGFFEKVGRRTEELKQRMTDAAAEGAMFECANCGTELFTEPDACPECGSEAIVERVEESGGAPDAGEPSERNGVTDDPSGVTEDGDQEATAEGTQEATAEGDQEATEQVDESDGAADSTGASED